MEVLTIPQAARHTGLSEAEVRQRIECGHLRATRRAGVRVIEAAELELRPTDPASGDESGRETIRSVQELLARIERQAVEVAELKKQLAEEQERHAHERRRLEAALRLARAAGRRGRPEDPDGGVPRGMRESLTPLFSHTIDP